MLAPANSCFLYQELCVSVCLQAHKKVVYWTFNCWNQTLPRPKCATGSISHRYPEPPSMIRVCGPPFLVYSTTLAPLAKAPNLVRGITRSQPLVVPWDRARKQSVSLHCVRLTLRLLRCLTNSHLVDFVDRERLRCTFTVRYEQLQAAVAVEVCGHSSCRSITVMMQLNSAGSSLHNIYYTHAGKHNVSTVIELIMWNTSVFFYGAHEEPRPSGALLPSDGQML